MTALDDLAALDQLVLTDVQRRERQREIKARAWEALRDQLPISRTLTATIGGVQRSVTVTITGMNLKRWLNEDGGVDWGIRLWGNDNRDLIDWPWTIVNPPLLVEDPLGPIVRTIDRIEWVDQGGPELVPVEHHDEVRFRFDVPQAVREAIRGAVLRAARRRG